MGAVLHLPAFSECCLDYLTPRDFVDLLPICRLASELGQPFQGIIAFALTRPRSQSSNGGDLSLHAWFRLWQGCLAVAEENNLEPSAFVRTVSFTDRGDKGTAKDPLLPCQAFMFIEDAWQRLVDQHKHNGDDVFVHIADAKQHEGMPEAPIFALSMESRVRENDEPLIRNVSVAGLFVLRDGRFALIWTQRREDWELFDTYGCFTAFIGPNLCEIAHLSNSILGRPFCEMLESGLLSWCELNWDGLDISGPWLGCGRGPLKPIPDMAQHLDQFERVARVLEAMRGMP